MGRSERGSLGLATIGVDRLTGGLWSGVGLGARLLRHLLSALARGLGHLAKGLDRAARRLEATEAGGCARTPELLPAELVVESETDTQPAATALTTVRMQPPPIPADARLPSFATGRKPSEHERIWQEVTSGRHPRLTTRRLSRATPAEAGAAPV
jgi:hypothetical protein